MLKVELDELASLRTSPDRPLRGCDLGSHVPRTLLYGTTGEGFTHHVYLDEQQRIRVHAYGACRNSSRPGRWLALDESQGLCDLDYVPKRLEPQYCDAEFCRRLQARNWVLPFAPWQAPHRSRYPFAGERIEATLGCNLRLLGCWDSFTQLRHVLNALNAQAIRSCSAANGAVYVVENDLSVAEFAVGLTALAA